MRADQGNQTIVVIVVVCALVTVFFAAVALVAYRCMVIPRFKPGLDSAHLMEAPQMQSPTLDLDSLKMQVSCGRHFVTPCFPFRPSELSLPNLSLYRKEYVMQQCRVHNSFSSKLLLQTLEVKVNFCGRQGAKATVFTSTSSSLLRVLSRVPPRSMPLKGSVEDFWQMC